MKTCTGAAVLAAVAGILGGPARFQSDNAKAFREVVPPAFSHLGIASARSRPHHPPTKGKIARFHQTLKRWLARQPPAHDLDELKAPLDLFRYIDNHQRTDLTAASTGEPPPRRGASPRGRTRRSSPRRPHPVQQRRRRQRHG